VWVLLWTALALFLANVPYLLGALLSTPDRVFGGAVYGVEDVNSYLAKMRQGADGAWLFHIPYTAEPHPGTIIYLFYLLLGKVGSALGLSLELAYHLARLVCGTLLGLAVYRFLAHWTAHRALRRIAFLLALFSSGIGWLLTLLGRSSWAGSLPLDLISPESYVFLTLYSPPHLALTTACLLWGLPHLREGAARHELSGVLIGSGLFATAALIGAFYLVVPYAVLGIDWLVTALRQRRPDGRALLLIALSGLPTAAVIGYDYYYFAFDPVYRIWAQQNLVPSLHPLHYVAGYLVVGALAVLGIAMMPRTRWAKLQLPLLWLSVVPLLLSIPFSAQRRLIIGAQVPLCLLAAIGLAYGIALPFGRSRLVRWLSRRPRYNRAGMRRWLIAALILLTVPTNLLLILGTCIEVLQRAPPIYHHRTELDALAWLRTHTDSEDTVLSAYETGNYVPAKAGNRVFLGLGPETIHAERKRGEVARFFDTEEVDAWRQELLREYDISYLLVGPTERALGQFDAGAVSYLRQWRSRRENTGPEIACPVVDRGTACRGTADPVLAICARRQGALLGHAAPAVLAVADLCRRGATGGAPSALESIQWQWHTAAGRPPICCPLSAQPDLLAAPG
jgi:hypothetical protein